MQVFPHFFLWWSSNHLLLVRKYKVLKLYLFHFFGWDWPTFAPFFSRFLGCGCRGPSWSHWAWTQTGTRPNSSSPRSRRSARRSRRPSRRRFCTSAASPARAPPCPRTQTPVTACNLRLPSPLFQWSAIFRSKWWWKGNVIFFNRSLGFPERNTVHDFVYSRQTPPTHPPPERKFISQIYSRIRFAERMGFHLLVFFLWGNSRFEV